MGTFHRNPSSSSLQQFSKISPFSWTGFLKNEMKSEERGLYSIHLLLTTANHIAAGEIEKANTCLDKLCHLSSPQGDAMQRLVAYFTEALAERVVKSIPGLHRALNTAKIRQASEEMQARRLFYEVCPFMKLAHAVRNKAIMEAIKGEKRVHIIDMDGCGGGQWSELLRELRGRKEGAPRVRITGVNERREVLEREAEEMGLGLEYCVAEGRVEEVDVGVRRGEAVVVSCVLQMHRMLGGGGGVERFVRGVRGVEPRLVVVVEKEGEHNGEGVVERVVEALYYYGAMFDSMVGGGCGGEEEGRVRVERMVYGEEIRNIVACEGVERRERHERVGRWVERMVAGGFFMQGLRCGGVEGLGGYAVREDGGCVFVCWKDTPLFSVSAWRCCGLPAAGG